MRAIINSKHHVETAGMSWGRLTHRPLMSAAWRGRTARSGTMRVQRQYKYSTRNLQVPCLDPPQRLHLHPVACRDGARRLHGIVPILENRGSERYSSRSICSKGCSAMPRAASSEKSPAAMDADARRAAVHAAVEEIIPAIRERQDETKELRRLPDETIMELKKSGYFRVLQPMMYGGLELTPQDFCRLNIRIAEACMSTGWVCGVVGVHPFQLALFDQRAQEEVWADDPDTLVSSSYAPMGKVERVPDGFRFSGRWGWSSGCDHCQWVLLGGIVPEEGYRTFLVPRSDYKIEDTWHVMGLQGTGSKDIVVAETFVPEYRTHNQQDGYDLTNPGNKVHRAPVFRIPWGQIFVRAVTNAAIGATKQALALYIEGALSKSSSDPAKLAGDSTTQSLIAETSVALHELEAVLYRNFQEMMDCVNAGQAIPMDSRVRSRYQASLVVERCLAVIDRMFSSAGGRSVFLDSRIQKIFLDMHTSRAHVANNPVSFGRNYGAVQLGMENKDTFV